MRNAKTDYNSAFKEVVILELILLLENCVDSKNKEEICKRMQKETLCNNNNDEHYDRNMNESMFAACFY